MNICDFLYETLTEFYKQSDNQTNKYNPPVSEFFRSVEKDQAYKTLFNFLIDRVVDLNTEEEISSYTYDGKYITFSQDYEAVHIIYVELMGDKYNLERYLKIFCPFLLEEIQDLRYTERLISFDYLSKDQLMLYFNSINFKGYNDIFDIHKLKEIAYFLRDYIDYRGNCFKMAEFLSIYGDCDVECEHKYKNWFRSNLVDHVAVDLTRDASSDFYRPDHLDNIDTIDDSIKYIYDNNIGQHKIYLHVKNRTSSYFSDSELLEEFERLKKYLFLPHMDVEFIFE